MKKRTTILLTLAILSTAAAAAPVTQKKGGIAVTLDVGERRDEGQVFNLVASSSNRKDDKQVDLVIHLQDEDGNSVSDCVTQVIVRALAKVKDEVMCREAPAYAQFTVEITDVGPAPKDEPATIEE